MLVDQLAHAGVAAARRAAAQHHRDEMAGAAPHRGDEIEPEVAGVAGLDAVDALDLAEQVVVVAHGAAAIDEARRARSTGSISGSAPGWRCRAAPGRARW